MNKLFDRMYDISVMLGKESIDFPGDISFSREFALTIEDNGLCNVSNLTMSAHAGTHLDSPLHFIPNGKKIEDYNPEDFILSARVVHIEDKTSIKPSHLQGLDLKPGEAVLFKTDNCMSGKLTSGVFSEDFVYFTPEAADLSVDKKLGLVGIDYPTIGRLGEESVEVHKKLLGNRILILEAINLREVPPGKYTLICLPLKIKDSEGSPVRAVLLN